MKRIALVLGMLAVLVGATAAKADYFYRDGKGNLILIAAGSAGGKTIPFSAMIDITGNPIGTNSNPLFVAFPTAQHFICDSGCGGGGGGGGLSVPFGTAIGGFGTPVGFKDASGNFQPLLGDTANGQWVLIKNPSIPVSGSVTIGGSLPAYAATPTFNLGTLNGAALASNQTAVQGSAGGGAAAAAAELIGGIYNVTPLTLSNGQQAAAQLDQNGYLKVNVVVGGGTGGTSSTFGSAFPVLGTPVGMTQGGNFVAFTGTSGNLNVQCANCSGSGASATDLAGFTAGTSVFAPMGGVFNDGLTAVTSGQQAMARITAQRAEHVNLRNTSGTEIGTASNPVQVSLANTAANSTAVKVDGSAATQPVSGTVTVQQAVAGSLQATVVPSSNSVWGLSAQGSATTSQIGPLVQGAVTSASPSYTTAQTNPLSLTTAGALRVDNSAVTQPVSQSGTWNINNIGGAISLPTGAAVSSLQPSNIAQGAALSTQTGTLSMGAVSSSAPTYTNGQLNIISLTASGALRIDGSGATQPVSGTVAVTNAGTFATQVTSMSALVAGSAVIGKVGIDQTTPGTTNLVSIGTNGTVNPQTAASWGIGTSAQNSATVANGHLILGQFNTSPTTITSGNMSPLQMDASGNVKVNIVTGASSGAVAQGSSTSGQTGGLIQAAATTAAPTYTTATTNPLSMDTSGNLRVTVTAAVGLGQGSTTSGQTGSLIMGAVTTGAPTYTTAQTSPISLDTAGNIRINCVTGCGGGTGGTASNFGSAFPTAGTAIGLTNGTNMIAWSASSNYGTSPGAIAVPAVNASVTNTVSVSNSGTFAVQAAQGAGSVASGAYLSGSFASGSMVDVVAEQAPLAAATATATKSLMIGGQFLTTQPTMTNTQQAAALFSNRGELLVSPGVSGFAVTLASTTITGSVAVNATQAGTWNIGSITTLPALVAGSAIIGKVGIDQTTVGTTNGVSLAQIGANTVLTGNGTAGTGAQRVTIASDNTAFSVNATLQASASTAIGKVDPNTIGAWGLAASTQNGTTPTNGQLMMGQFNTTPTTITTGNISPFQLDNAGNLLVNIKTGSSSGAVAQGSTTSGQTGGLIQAAATSAAPTYTTATTNPLSMDTAGNLRVSVTSSVGLAQGSTTSGQTGSMIMGAVTTSSPTYTTAQTSPLSLDTTGALRVNVTAGGAGGGAVFGPTAVGSAAANPPVLFAGTANATATGNVQVAKVTSGGVLSTDISTVNAVTVLTGTGAVGTGAQRVAVGTDTATIAGSAPGTAGTPSTNVVSIQGVASGTVVPTKDSSTGTAGSGIIGSAAYAGANGSGNLTGEIVCDKSIVYDASTSGSTQLVALASGQTIYVCGYAISTGSTATNVNLAYGTGTACATGNNKLTPAYQIGANSGIVDHGSNHWGGMKSAASNELCLNTSAANPVQATVYYTQF